MFTSLVVAFINKHKVKIIFLSVFIVLILGVYIYISILTSQINSLRDKNEALIKEKEILTLELTFELEKNKIDNIFTNSKEYIENITNEEALSEDKRQAIDSINNDFYNSFIQLSNNSESER